MDVITTETVSSDFEDLASEVADQIESFLIALGAVAREDFPDGSLSILLLEVSQLLLAGARLGAIVDIVPEESYEPDLGLDPDADELRERLAELLGAVDEYVEVFDPYDPDSELVPSQLSDDLADVAADLVHGLRHFRGGRPLEAMWWWQFSYLSNWGATASSALRAIHSAVAHTRLDSEESAAAGEPAAEPVGEPAVGS